MIFMQHGLALGLYRFSYLLCNKIHHTNTFPVCCRKGFSLLCLSRETRWQQMYTFRFLLFDTLPMAVFLLCQEFFKCLKAGQCGNLEVCSCNANSNNSGSRVGCFVENCNLDRKNIFFIQAPLLFRPYLYSLYRYHYYCQVVMPRRRFFFAHQF